MLKWMYWTWQSAVGFGLFALLLLGLTLWDRVRPSVPRKGLLFMTTTRGDRVFLGIAWFLALVFGWLKFAPEVSAWWVSALGACSAAAILRWG